MARTIPTTEPTQLIAGDSWEWDRTLGDYPPDDGWELSYVLRGNTDLTIAFDDAAGPVSADAGVFEVRVPPATTATVLPGTYRLVGQVDDGTDRFVVYDATLTVEQNPATVVDSKTQAEIDLASVQSAIAARLAGDQPESYTINGREIQRIPLAELYRIESRLLYRIEVKRSGRMTVPVPMRFRAPA